MELLPEPSPQKPLPHLKATVTTLDEHVPGGRRQSSRVPKSKQPANRIDALGEKPPEEGDLRKLISGLEGEGVFQSNSVQTVMEGLKAKWSNEDAKDFQLLVDNIASEKEEERSRAGAAKSSSFREELDESWKLVRSYSSDEHKEQKMGRGERSTWTTVSSADVAPEKVKAETKDCVPLIPWLQKLPNTGDAFVHEAEEAVESAYIAHEERRNALQILNLAEMGSQVSEESTVVASSDDFPKAAQVCGLLRAGPCGGGTCRASDAFKGGYTCDCPAGYVTASNNAAGYQTCLLHEACFSGLFNPCGVGRCGNDGFGGYMCDCPQGFAPGSSLLGGVLSATCIPGSTKSHTALTIQTFEETQPIASQNGAFFNGGQLQLTNESSTFSLTSAFLNTSIFLLRNSPRLGECESASFSTSFSINITSSTGSFANGLVLILLSENANIEDVNRDPQYTGENKAQVGSLSVEFDTSNSWTTNAEAFSDCVSSEEPDSSHVSILTDFLLCSPATASTLNTSLDLRNGAVKFVWVVYDATSTTLSVFLSLNATRPLAPLVCQQVDLCRVLRPSACAATTCGNVTAAYVGFASSNELAKSNTVSISGPWHFSTYFQSDSLEAEHVTPVGNTYVVGDANATCESMAAAKDLPVEMLLALNPFLICANSTVNDTRRPGTFLPAFRQYAPLAIGPVASGVLCATYYFSQQGDSCLSIATKFHSPTNVVNASSIAEMNPAVDCTSNILARNTQICVKAGGVASFAPCGRFYTVQPHDTCWSIIAEYESQAAWLFFSNNRGILCDHLRAGDEVCVYSYTPYHDPYAAALPTDSTSAIPSSSSSSISTSFASKPLDGARATGGWCLSSSRGNDHLRGQLVTISPGMSCAALAASPVFHCSSAMFELLNGDTPCRDGSLFSGANYCAPFAGMFDLVRAAAKSNISEAGLLALRNKLYKCA
eukprot:TRINITY_DN18879_c0_g1_i1.p1 TRINITY_DN18879_c0_g1~~TRINITY_DN18879_c0_g1_i1.p1  ORF type:complete len:980 (-),score=106.48 TRINITY_DN18879_c0_g1_i1:248-3079(-)